MSPYIFMDLTPSFPKMDSWKWNLPHERAHMVLGLLWHGASYPPGQLCQATIRQEWMWGPISCLSPTCPRSVFSIFADSTEPWCNYFKECELLLSSLGETKILGDNEKGMGSGGLALPCPQAACFPGPLNLGRCAGRGRPGQTLASCPGGVFCAFWVYLDWSLWLEQGIF